MRLFSRDRFDRSKLWPLSVAACAWLTQCGADFPEPRTTSHANGDYVEVPYLPPAALVEVGYVSNPEQEQQLTSADYQARIAEALLDAIVKFRAQLERTAQ